MRSVVLVVMEIGESIFNAARNKQVCVLRYLADVSIAHSLGTLVTKHGVGPPASLVSGTKALTRLPSLLLLLLVLARYS